MKTSRYRILLIALLAALVGGVVWQVVRRREPEPVYQGKPLSFWVESNASAMHGSVAYRQAEEAIRQIGTNAIPTLLQWLRANDTPLTSRVFELAAKQHFIKVRHTSAYRRNGMAQDVFRRLGTSAKDAVPELSKIYDQNISVSSQCATAIALAWIGPAAKSAVPSLLRGINNPDEGVSVQTIYALGYIHAGSEQVVPALIQCLKDRSPNVKKSALWTLGEFGPDAKAAVPAILPFLNNSASWLGSEATTALKRIDPEAAAKAGVQ